jgi:hypothetical protein
MEQSVMVFADAAARTTALTGVVAEGMLSYLKDTNAVEVYDGANWVASDDPNAIQNTIVDAKGDLITATAADTPARLAVGNNGETLVANSAAATGLSYKEDYAAGKNKIINGDFSINQRAFTATPASNSYYFDRWVFFYVDGTNTCTPQVFTPGAAPVAGYESTNFTRISSTGQTLADAITRTSQRIEDVRTLAGQTATVSFYAKADSGTPSIAIQLNQIFGSGGSSVLVNFVSKVAISTSWVRYSATFAVPSISGKTIGTSSRLDLALVFSAGSDYNAATGTLGIQSNTFDIWGIQVEAGSVATAFQTATGTIQGELAACQRYYYRNKDSSTNFASFIPAAITANTTQSDAYLPLPVTMRTKPSSVDFSNLQTFDYVAGAGYAISNVTINSNSSPNIVVASLTFATATAGRFIIVRGDNSSSAFLGFSAEL